MTSPKVQKILKRLLLEPDFKGLIKQAQADPDNVRKYVQQARKRFGLSQYWEVLLKHVLIIGTFNEKILHSGLAIERGFDAVTEQEYFKIVVFPETSQKEVVTTYGRIARIYEENGQDIDIRTAKRLFEFMGEVRWKNTSCMLVRVLIQKIVRCFLSRRSLRSFANMPKTMTCLLSMS